jgi:hypothetical protein
MILTRQNVCNVFQTSNCSKNFTLVSTIPNALYGRLSWTRNLQNEISLYVAAKGFRIHCLGTSKPSVALFVCSSTLCVYSSTFGVCANSVPCTNSFKWEVLRACICISKAKEIYDSCSSYSIHTVRTNQSSAHAVCTVICSPFYT